MRYRGNRAGRHVAQVSQQFILDIVTPDKQQHFLLLGSQTACGSTCCLLRLRTYAPDARLRRLLLNHKMTRCGEN